MQLGRQQAASATETWSAKLHPSAGPSSNCFVHNRLGKCKFGGQPCPHRANLKAYRTPATVEREASQPPGGEEASNRATARQPRKLAHPNSRGARSFTAARGGEAKWETVTRQDATRARATKNLVPRLASSSEDIGEEIARRIITFILVTKYSTNVSSVSKTAGLSPT